MGRANRQIQMTARLKIHTGPEKVYVKGAAPPPPPEGSEAPPGEPAPGGGAA